MTALSAAVLADPTTAAFPGRNGSIAYVTNASADDRFDVHIARGHDRRSVDVTRTAPFESAGPRWSPDGRRLVLAQGPSQPIRPTRWELYVIDADGSHRTRLTKNKVVEFDPAWSPDGSRIVFGRAPARGHSDLFSMELATRRITRLTRTPTVDESAPDWSPDGRRILFRRDGPQAQVERPSVWLKSADGTRRRRIAAGSFARWAPDGRTIVFSPAFETIATLDVDGSATPTTIYRGEQAIEPTFAPDGKSIAFLRSSSRRRRTPKTTSTRSP